MSIRDDFAPYIDGNGLLAPNPVPAGTQVGSDNGPMFTSEYYIMLKKNGFLTTQDQTDYQTKIGACVDAEDMLCRTPGGTGQEGPDDYYGVTNGCIELANTTIPRELLWAIFRYAGFLDNNSPGTLTIASFLIRQPQLFCAVVNASFPSLLNPLHWFVRILANPLYIISAIILLTSCMNDDPSDTDSRRLAWHLGNNLSKTSLFCWLGYKVWLNRLSVAYPDKMNSVASVYYQPNGSNPYSDWWVT